MKWGNIMRVSKRNGLAVCCFLALIGATAVAAGNDLRLEQMRILRATEAYQSPPVLEQVTEAGLYERPASVEETVRFSVAELRSALSQSDEHVYTDLGRFHDLQTDDRD
ncbi:MAG: hypothetical protein ACI8TQ_000573 [Planctomycetota bacterium]|jgi:hypothetical protein